MQLSSVQSNKIQLLASVPAHPDRTVCLCKKNNCKNYSLLYDEQFWIRPFVNRDFLASFPHQGWQVTKRLSRKSLAQGNKGLAHYLTNCILFYKYVYFDKFQPFQIFQTKPVSFKILCNESDFWHFSCKKLKGLDSKLFFLKYYSFTLRNIEGLCG